ncbi:AbiH family protein [Maribellus sp. YY47]|uniref:AbiH family protein n=1 Tax=Maribellus sp. YY47 TaxID=2929486 RepID=UPI0020008D55|nr:AbiH family protein [Maribellus sp. YY47]MCK3684794.1 bacteriophage abortive infection AbiH family protein [Maribellus sp. YY47]
MNKQSSFQIPENVYNRIILVGNGFDLALGLNTRYSDFLLYYLKKNCETQLLDYPSGNELFSIDERFTNAPGYYGSLYNHIKDEENIDSVVKFLQDHLAVSFHSELLRTLIKHHQRGRWVDIESVYYTLLNKYHSGTGRDKIRQLNQSMDVLLEHLNAYIIEVQKGVTEDHYDHFRNLAIALSGSIPISLRNLIKIQKNNTLPSSILFLNFNYTNTITKFINIAGYQFRNIDTYEIFIHGSVGSDDNPIIFGYGDDTGEEYKALENSNNPEYLRMIKSFKYPQTNNYHNLLNFLEQSDFEVFVLGHSCGLSDRTLLKTIFEHENCIAIQLYNYNGKDEFFYKSIEVSRHFDNKMLMRERLLPYSELAKIPQNT